MDDRSLKVLEFDHLLDILKEYSIFSNRPETLQGVKAFRKTCLRFNQDPLKFLKIKEILETVGDPPLQGMKDIEEVLKRLAIRGPS